jgi:hypothetical protein
MGEMILSRLTDKLYLKLWVIGICRGNINEIMESRIFNPVVDWIPLSSPGYYTADPFPFITDGGNMGILFEDFGLDEYYGKISLMTLDKDFRRVNQKVILDTGSHLSYPFIFREEGRFFLFPEAGHSGKLICYEYNPSEQCAFPLTEISGLPLLDPTILKYEDKYWLFGTMQGKDMNSKLYIFYSRNLLGPYNPHRCNPVKNNDDGSRPAGSFFKIGSEIYRPAQNCKTQYGESISIFRVKVLNEYEYTEEYHMSINAGSNNQFSDIMAIHTINIINDIIVIDGLRWTFSPADQFRVFFKNRADRRKLKEIVEETGVIRSDGTGNLIF